MLWDTQESKGLLLKTFWYIIRTILKKNWQQKAAVGSLSNLHTQESSKVRNQSPSTAAIYHPVYLVTFGGF